METKVVARIPIVFSAWWKSLCLLLAAIVYLYLCLDMPFFHHLQKTSNPTNWIILGILIFLNCLTAPIVLLRNSGNILKADSSGEEFKNSFFSPKTRIPSRKIVDVKSGKYTFIYRRLNLPEVGEECDAVEIIFNDSIELSMIDGVSVRANPKNKSSILISGYLFVGDINDLRIVVEKLHLLRSKAINSKI